MTRCAADRPNAWSSRSFPAVVPFRAAENLRQQLLRVLCLHAEADADLHDAASFEVAHPQDLLVARLEAGQRLVTAQLVGQAVEDARRRGVGTLERFLVVQRLDDAPVLPPPI